MTDPRIIELRAMQDRLMLAGAADDDLAVVALRDAQAALQVLPHLVVSVVLGKAFAAFKGVSCEVAQTVQMLNASAPTPEPFNVEAAIAKHRADTDADLAAMDSQDRYSKLVGG